MNSDTKILFLDIDDTLLTTAKEITPGVKDAISRAAAAGHKIVITTGRPYSAAMRFIDALGLDVPGCYAVCDNGGEIRDTFTGEALVSRPLSVEDASYIIRKAREAGVHVQTYDSECVISPENDEELRYYVSRTHMQFRVAPDLPDSLVEPPLKVVVIGLTGKEKMDALRESLSEWMTDRVDSFYSSNELLEFVGKGISKGAAVHELAALLEIPMENTIAAGDSENDLSMITEAAVGCAMANGTDAVKAAADYITERDCDHDGVAEIIEKFMLS